MYMLYFTIFFFCYFLAFNDARGHEMERPNYIQDLLSANWTDMMTISENDSSRGIWIFFIFQFFRVFLRFFFFCLFSFQKEEKEKT